MKRGDGDPYSVGYITRTHRCSASSFRDRELRSSWSQVMTAPDQEYRDRFGWRIDDRTERTMTIKEAAERL